MATTFFVQSDSGEFFVIKDDGQRQTTVSGPWYESQVAQRQSENAAQKAARTSGGEAIWTVKPDDVAAREYQKRGEHGSRAAWIVR